MERVHGSVIGLYEAASVGVGCCRRGLASVGCFVLVV